MEIGSLQPRNSQEAQKYSRFLKRFERIVDVRVMIDSDKENFVIQTPENDSGGNFRKISIIPIEIDKFADGYFDSEYQVFLSATIDKENFSRSIGMGECAFIDMAKSPFPKENRDIKFLNVRQLSQSSSLEDRIEVINQIGKILQKHEKDRGLILTSSKKRCFEILKYLPKEQHKRIQIAHSENDDGSTIEEILENHKNTTNGVLLSSSLWQGIDLKDDLSRFQIIEKCPYLYLGDKRVMIKKQKDPKWYRYQTTMKLLQGFGRSIRNEKDYAMTYVMDQAVTNLLAYNKNMVPVAYHDVIYN
jgi:Rad3-related DNA helicase